MVTEGMTAATAAERPAIFADGGTALDDLAALANASHAAAEASGRSLVVHARDCGQTLMLAKIKAEMGAACPKGGDHDWTQDDDGAYCAKCLEPAGGAK